MNLNVYISLFTYISIGLSTEPNKKWDFNLPTSHIQKLFVRHKLLRDECSMDISCPYKLMLQDNVSCWGYEPGCKPDYSSIKCTQGGAGSNWRPKLSDQVKLFYESGDFGYIQKRNDELVELCNPIDNNGASLRCSDYTRHCIAKNLYIDFNDAKINENSNRYLVDIFPDDQRFGAHCKMTENWGKMSKHKSTLQSWYEQMEFFSELKFDAFKDNELCDITITKPVIFVKLDAGVNMFHHFCDFINIYASQHANGSFEYDNQIIIFETSRMPYNDLFKEMWQAFSANPILQLKDYQQKRVCFKDVLFSLLPRMRYGMFFNMPLIPDCEGTRLFTAFNEHLIHRLNIKQRGPLKDKLRITILDRKSKYRLTLNQDELVAELRKNPRYEVNLVSYKYREMPFLEQVEITHNSDMFIGMHGAGLTHGLFLPPWAVLFELYNCDDPDCYKDLARLRGIHYITWSNMDLLEQQDEGHHPNGGPHQKFTNFSFNVKEFVRLVDEGIQHVTSHHQYRSEYKRMHAHSKHTNIEL